MRYGTDAGKSARGTPLLNAEGGEGREGVGGTLGGDINWGGDINALDRAPRYLTKPKSTRQSPKILDKTA